MADITNSTSNLSKGYVIPEDISDYLISLGFSKKSTSLFVASSHNAINTYFLYITDCGRYRLVMETKGRGIDEKTEIFRGFKIRGITDLEYLLSYNVFTSPVLKEKKADVSVC